MKRKIKYKHLRKNSGFRALSTFVASLFLFSTVLNIAPNTVVTKADTVENQKLNSEAFKELNVNWLRTKDIRVNSSFNVHNSISKFDKYWDKSGSVYTMKKYENIDSSGTSGVDAEKSEEGIFLMNQLFTEENKTVVFDYDALTKTMGATDTNVWDGKGSNPYSQYRQSVVNEYLQTGKGEYYHLRDIQNPINPTTNIKREDDLNINNFPDYATWQYMPYNNSTRGTEQMRLFKGNFEVEPGDLDKYNYYITSGDNKDNVLAIDDTVMVLVDGIPTNINYTTANYKNTTIKLQNANKTYDMEFNQTDNYRAQNNLPVTGDINSKEGNRRSALSVFTDTLHVYLGGEVRDTVNGSQILGDVTSNMKEFGGISHKIEVIASDYNLSGGMTKLNIIRVAKPSTELVKNAYVQDKLVASSQNGSSSTIKNNDTINYKFIYKNTTAAPIYNILFEDDLLKATVGVKDNQNVFVVNGKTYAASDFKVEKFDKDGNVVKSSDGSMLQDKSSTLQNGEYIVVSSDKLSHTPTNEEVNAGYVQNTVTASSSYQGYYKEEKITDKADAKVTVKINDNPKIKLVKEAYGDENYNSIIASSDPLKGIEVSSIAKGQTAYYKFKITNVGDSVIRNLCVIDDDLKVKADKTEYSKYSKDSLCIEKYDSSGNKMQEISGLDCLEELNLNETIVIYDKINIKKDDINDSFKNTVKVIGKSESGKDVTSDASVLVVPKEPDISVEKTAFTNIINQSSISNVSIGENIYYKFTAKNDGNTNLQNIYFKDDKFNGRDSIKISEDGVFVNGVKQDTNNLLLVKYDSNGNSKKGGLELLSELQIGEKVSVVDLGNLFRQTFNEDINKNLSNTVKVYGTFKAPGKDETVTDTDTAVVRTTLQKINVTKTASKLDVNSPDGKLLVADSQKPDQSISLQEGTKVYYTIGLENVGPFKVNNIRFDDKNLNILVSTSGIVRNGATLDPKNTKVIKYAKNDKDTTLVSGGLELLKEDLMPGWKIEVSNDDYFNDDKVVNEAITNIVSGKGDYKLSDDGDVKTTDEVEAKVEIPVYSPEVNPEITKTQIKAQKQAKVYDTLVADSDDQTVSKKVSIVKSIEYTLIAENIGNTTLKNISLNDLDLNLKISRDGVTKNGAIVKGSLGFKVAKYDEDGSLIVAGSFNNIADILQELKKGQKIVVSDESLLSFASSTPQVVENTVVVKGEGEDKNPSDSAKVEVALIDGKVDITKDVYKITRDGRVIYDKNKDSIDPAKVRVYPSDKVQFTYTIKNNTEIDANDLLIKDILKNPDMDTFKNVTEWTFTKDSVKFNDQSFNLKAGDSINIISNEWIVPDNCKKNVINEISLYQKQKDGTEVFINKDDANLLVYPKVFVNMDCTSDVNKQFYVTVKGDNGFEISMYIKDKDKVDISDLLDFDVTYTVIETIPMNFTLNGVDIQKGTDIFGNKKIINGLQFNLMTVNHIENITLHNEKRDSEEFQADSDVTNTLVYKNK